MTMRVDGNRIRELRLERSWSQETLAERAGLSLRTIQRMETDSVASLQSRGAVANAFAVPASQFDLPEQTPDARRSLHASDRLWKLAAAAALLLALGIFGVHEWQSIEPATSVPAEVRRIATVGFGDIENIVSATGTLIPREVVPVEARAGGELVETLVDVGDRVERGQVLARLDARDRARRVRTSQLELEMLRNQLPQRTQALEIAEGRLARLAGLGPEFEGESERARNELLGARESLANLHIRIELAESDLEREQVQLAQTEILSPESGTVIARHQKSGAMLDTSRGPPTVFEVADLTRMTAVAEIPEDQVRLLGENVQAFILPIGDDDRRPVTLREINPMGTVRDGLVSFQGLLDVDNTSRELYWNMTVRVEFVTTTAENVLVVPVNSLVIDEGRESSGDAAVEIVLADGSTEFRSIVPGVIDDVNAEVVSGLAEGDRVIVRGEQS